MDHLVLVGEMSMKANGGGDRENGEDQGDQSGAVADDQQDAAEQFDGQRDAIGDIRQGQVRGLDIADGACGIGKLADATHDEQHGQ